MTSHAKVLSGWADGIAAEEAGALDGAVPASKGAKSPRTPRSGTQSSDDTDSSSDEGSSSSDPADNQPVETLMLSARTASVETDMDAMTPRGSILKKTPRSSGGKAGSLKDAASDQAITALRLADAASTKARGASVEMTAAGEKVEKRPSWQDKQRARPTGPGGRKPSTFAAKAMLKKVVELGATGTKGGGAVGGGGEETKRAPTSDGTASDSDDADDAAGEGKGGGGAAGKGVVKIVIEDHPDDLPPSLNFGRKKGKKNKKEKKMTKAMRKKKEARKKFKAGLAEEMDQDFGLGECLFHIVAVACCIQIGYGLLTKDMYTLSKSTPEGLSMSSNFQHTLYDFEDIDTSRKFEEWLSLMVVDHYAMSDAVPKKGGVGSVVTTNVTGPEWSGGEWENCGIKRRTFNRYGMQLNGGIMVSQQRGRVIKGAFIADTGTYGQDHVSKMAAAIGQVDTNGNLVDAMNTAASVARVNRSFTHTKLLAGWPTDESELGVVYPYGSGFHYMFDPDMTLEEAEKSITDMFRGPFIDPLTRMIHVTMWYTVDWAEVEVAAVFSVEVSMAGFYFPHWKFKALELSAAEDVNISIIVLNVIFALQVREGSLAREGREARVGRAGQEGPEGGARNHSEEWTVLKRGGGQEVL
jgi:hypothetical protein